MISIRRMNAQDVPAARFLLSQLGYVLGSEEIRRRYEKVTSSQDHALLVGTTTSRRTATPAGCLCRAARGRRQDRHNRPCPGHDLTARAEPGAPGNIPE